ncbi:MAG: L-threonine 3-dehydrogenase [Candidatus Kapaibacterium sp.]|jgi:nucleoside-diphosphate-sugar epimerase|nr:MAG: L-threonine 3-dehydrogenase [Candidatus Kapabacteria bacterium]ROL56607.1 MAG: NAD-dependent epimerase/dehydratase family protein [Bacteroidetes/Chlorobi group bacterium Naka2016]
MKKETKRILVTGASGQIGSELTLALRKIYGNDNVIASDIAEPQQGSPLANGIFEKLDVTNFDAFEQVVKKHNIDTIVHLAAILSAVGESNPTRCWNVNIGGTLNAFNLGVKYEMSKIFVPSSIAVWGPGIPKIAPQDGVLKPKTMYGVTKVTIETLGDYYFHKYGLDCRGVRYPGIISSETPPGGGTTDYAVEIFYKAVRGEKFICFVNENTRLPMMYMPDCLKAAIDLLKAPVENLTHHCDYNVGSMSFTVKSLYEEIRKYYPNFEIEYKPDYRQAIADSWPDDVDDSVARKDWGWQPEYDLPRMVEDMIEKLKVKLARN